MDLLRVSIRRAGFVDSLMNPNLLLAPLAVSSGVGTAGLRCSSSPARLPYFSTPSCIVCLLCCSISSLPLGGAGAWEAGM